MRKTGVCRLVLSVGAVAVLTTAAWADSIWIAGADNKASDKGLAYNGRIEEIKVVGGQASLILIWEASGQPKPAPISRVRRVAADEVPALGVAEEAYAGGDYKKAASLYGALASKSPLPAWVGSYVNFRLMECCGQTKQFAPAVKALIDLCRAGSPLADVARLPAVQPKGSPDNTAAATALDEVLAAKPPVAYAEKLKRMRMNILLVEGDAAQVLPLVEAELKNPDEEIRSQARIKQVALLLALGKYDEMAQDIALGRKELDAEYGPQLFFYEGRLLYEKKDFLHAALAFMRTPVLYSMSNKALAAESLVWAARAMQAAQAPKVEVLAPLHEAVEKYPGTDGAAQAEKMLKELGA